MGLAGPKTKQRIQVDPRNKSWSDDKSKFGFKMLSKMGWAEGKGLGLREDGQVDHIKVRLKIDSLGVGADKKTADNWLGNNDAFSTLLDGMNKRINGDGSVVPAESSKEDVVEEKPKEDKLSKVLTQGRLYHRKKFLRNKMVSNFDAKDLNHILGVKEDKKPESDTPVPVKEKEPEQKPSRIIEPVVTVVRTTDMNSYFAKRMKGLGIKATGIAQPISNASGSSDDEEGTSGGFGLGLGFSKSDSNNDTGSSDENANENSKTLTKKKKKDKSAKLDVEEKTTADDGSIKKKKKKELKQSDLDEGESETQKSKKEKKKRSSESQDMEDVDTESKKKKKKRKSDDDEKTKKKEKKSKKS